MFTLLSKESVSATPTRNALYISFIIHVCAWIGVTWFSLKATPPVPFKLTAIFAGTPEPVREPQLIYAPVMRRARRSSEVPAAVAKSARRKAEISPVHQNDEGGRPDYMPTAIPSDLLAMLDTDSVAAPGRGSTMAGTRGLSLQLPLGDESLPPPPPEPPPGDPDVERPPVIGGHLEQAVLIQQTKPVYPALARTARVEGIVVLEGTISEQGKVEDVHVVSGHPMLVDAAIKAVQKWKYRPAKLNGQIMSCPVRIQVRFMLKYPGD